jgi:hypothetical protein
LAGIKLKELGLKKTEKEEKLFYAWDEVMRHAKNAGEYDPEFKYGFWQIIDEINSMKRQSGTNRRGEPTYEPKYPYLNVAVKELDRLVKDYYESEIIADLFKYELIK